MPGDALAARRGAARPTARARRHRFQFGAPPGDGRSAARVTSTPRTLLITISGNRTSSLVQAGRAHRRAPPFVGEQVLQRGVAPTWMPYAASSACTRGRGGEVGELGDDFASIGMPFAGKVRRIMRWKPSLYVNLRDVMTLYACVGG